METKRTFNVLPDVHASCPEVGAKYSKSVSNSTEAYTTWPEDAASSPEVGTSCLDIFSNGSRFIEDGRNHVELWPSLAFDFFLYLQVTWTWPAHLKQSQVDIAALLNINVSK